LDYLCHESKAEWDYVHHWKCKPNLVAPALTDPVGTSLRILSYHLRELTLRGQFDKSLFWPQEDSSPVWPQLQKVSIELHMVSPSGVWYFEGPLGEGRSTDGYELGDKDYPSDDEHSCDIDDYPCRSFEDMIDCQFRIAPNDTTLGPFLMSFAKGAVNMPELKYAEIWSPLRWNPNDLDNYSVDFDYFNPPHDFLPDHLAWGLKYCAPGQTEAFETIPGACKMCTVRNMWWDVGPWRPAPCLHDAFRCIGEKRHGRELNEYWNEGKPDHTLPTQDYFEDYDANIDD
jgi:hypothetical protein